MLTKSFTTNEFAMPVNTYNKYGLLICLLFIMGLSKAQTHNKYAAFSGNGFIYAHSKDVENTKGSKPFNLMATYSWQKQDSNYFNIWGGLPTQGIAICYTNFNNAILGESINLNYFIEPNITITGTTGINFNVGGGLVYATKPYDALKNNTNNSYSTHLSFYLSAGIKPYWQISPKLQLEGWLSYNHLSNGGVKLPNKGVNWIMTNIGIAYYPYSKLNTKKIIENFTQVPPKKKIRTGISSFIAHRSLNNESAVTYMIAGLQMQKAWQTARTHAITAGVEMYYDAALAKQLKKDNLLASAFKVGILGGHEFLWGKFGFSQQLGIYLFDESPYYPVWYHRWGFQYYKNNWQLGVGLKAHKHVALFPEVRFGYNWYKERKR